MCQDGKLMRKSSLFIRVTDIEFIARLHAWQPPTDLFETDDGYTIRIEIAGMDEDDFSIRYDNNYLVISGRRPLLNAKCAYHRMEISTGDFYASILLPENIDINSATAEYNHGFLTIQIPKTNPINIEINSKKEI